MKNKIFVIFTGGTIGSSVKDGFVAPDGRNRFKLLEGFARERGDKISFDTSNPVNMLSENISEGDLQAIIAALRAVDAASYDGVIVTHGTDTLSFTANVLSQVFADYPLPVVLVSSLYPLDDKRNNGYKNFAAAVDFIAEGIRGVYVAYRNHGEEYAQIHLASRACAVDYSGCMYSFGGVPFGEVKEGAFVYRDCPSNPAPAKINGNRKKGFDGKICADICVLSARPLINFTEIAPIAARARAVLLKLYHSGTVCTVGKGGFSALSDECKARGVPLVVGPLDSSANVYKSADGAFSACIAAQDMSFGVTVAKVMLALGEGRDIAEALSENTFFEKIR